MPIFHHFLLEYPKNLKNSSAISVFSVANFLREMCQFFAKIPRKPWKFWKKIRFLKKKKGLLFKFCGKIPWKLAKMARLDTLAKILTNWLKKVKFWVPFSSKFHFPLFFCQDKPWKIWKKNPKNHQNYRSFDEKEDSCFPMSLKGKKKNFFDFSSSVHLF